MWSADLDGTLETLFMFCVEGAGCWGAMDRGRLQDPSGWRSEGAPPQSCPGGGEGEGQGHPVY